MANIRRSIESNNEETSGYTGLLAAIINHAVKDLQLKYGELIEKTTKKNYDKYKMARLFFENSCNGYCGPELSSYILEKALKIEEENHDKNSIYIAKKYIKSADLGSS